MSSLRPRLMTMHRIGETLDVLPRAVNDGPDVGDEFCHIVDQSLTRYYCGRPCFDRGMLCKKYEGEAICPSCGKPTCPRCATQSSLNARLEGYA